MNKRKLTEYGKAVKTRLFVVEMTQTELAEQIGCSRQYLARILVGERSGKKYGELIEKILGVSYSQYYIE